MKVCNYRYFAVLQLLTQYVAIERRKPSIAYLDSVDLHPGLLACLLVIVVRGLE